MAVRTRRKASARSSNGGRTPRKWGFRPSLEALEGRLAPAAGVFTVTTLADDGSAGSLRGAVNQADKFIGAAQVVFAVNGVFKLSQFNVPGTPSPNTGDIDITNNITFIGNGINQTIIDAAGIDRAFWISGPLTVNFNDLSIRNGIANTVSSTGLTAAVLGSEGGAVYAATAGATLNFTNVSITGNRANSNGGAIAAESAAINITNGYISSNYSAGDGGAISVDTGAAVTVVNSHLELNFSYEHGGAIYIGSNVGTQPTLTINGSLLNNNRAVSDGGAVYDSSTTGGGVSLFNTSMINNVTGSSGGAIWTTGDISIDGNGGAPLAINGRNNIGFNNSDSYGGAIYQTSATTQPASLFIANTNLSANRAYSYGGAVYTSALSATLDNCLMVVNVAGYYGGAVYCSATNSTLTITGSVLNNNSSGSYGGAVYSSSDVTKITGSRFDFNAAVDGGGAIYDYTGTSFAMADSFVDNNTSSQSSGGGVYTSKDTATFTNSQIVSNTAADEGGGIAWDGTTINVTDCLIVGNTTYGGHGGGIDAGGTTATFVNNIVNSNVAYSSGGGIYADSTTVNILNCTVRNNVSMADGGGIYTTGTTLVVGNTVIANNQGDSDGGGVYTTSTTATFTNDLITGNTAGSSGGGIYYSFTTGTLAVNASTISDNTASYAGGGVYTNATEVDFLAPGLGSLISGNTAGTVGGGVYRTYTGAGPDVGAKFTNVTFAGNSASSIGGAIYSAYGGTNAAGVASLILMNDTINLNAAGSGGAVFASNTGPAGSKATVTIDNTIIAGAPPGSGPNFASSGAGVTFASKAPGSNLTDNPNDLVVNGGKLSGFAANNVGLGPLQDNGGPTFTFALLPNSPAINAATADQNPADGVPNADQRGVSRPQPTPGGTVDIGAFEAVPNDFLIAAAPAPGNSGGVNINVYQALPTGAGTPPLVGTVNASDFTGGVHVALADVNDDGVPDLIVGSGAGQAPLVEVFSLNKNNGTFGSKIGSKIVPFSTAFTGGVFVAGGNFNRDKHADVVVGAGQGGGPEVKIFTLYKEGSDTLLGTPTTINLRGSGSDGGFFAFSPSFTGGVTVGVSDINGDGQDDVLAGQASNGGSFSAFDGTDVRTPLIAAQQAFGSAFTGGVNIAGGNFGRNIGGITVGSINGDIVVGQASGGGSVKVFSGDTKQQVGNTINPFGSTYTGGVSVSTVQDINGNQLSEIIVGQTSGQGQIKVIDSGTLAFLDTFFANTAFTSGVFVGGGF